MLPEGTVEYWDKQAGYQVDNLLKRRRLVRVLLKYDMSNTKILEIGTGLGITATAIKFLYGDRIKYVGTDISPKFCAFARNMGHEIYQTEATNLPFDNNSFDIFFAFDVLEHIPYKDRDSVFDEINRVLDENAMIFINNPHPNNPNGHNKAYDFTFDENDIANLCKRTKCIIREIVRYDGHPSHLYQVIVLGKGKFI